MTATVARRADPAAVRPRGRGARRPARARVVARARAASAAGRPCSPPTRTRPRLARRRRRSGAAQLDGRARRAGHGGPRRCGLTADENGVRADRPLFARSADAWRAALKSWIDDPAQEQAVDRGLRALRRARRRRRRAPGETVLAQLAPPRPPRAARAPARADGARAPPAERVPARRRRRARRRAPRDVRRQARRRAADRRPRALGGRRRRQHARPGRPRASPPAPPPASSASEHARTLDEAWELLAGPAARASGRAASGGPAARRPSRSRARSTRSRAATCARRSARSPPSSGSVDREIAAEQAFGTGALMARARPTTRGRAAYAERRCPRGRDDWRAAPLGGRRPRDDRAGPAARRDHLDRRRADRRRPGRPGAALYRARAPGAPARGRVDPHPRHPPVRPRGRAAARRGPRRACSSALTGRLLVAHAAFVERGFLEPALATRGVRLRGEIADTRQLGRVWLADRDPGTHGAAARARRAGGAARPAGPPRAPRARRRAHDGAGVPGAGDPSGAPRAAVGEDAAGAAEGRG